MLEQSFCRDRGGLALENLALGPICGISLRVVATAVSVGMLLDVLTRPAFEHDRSEWYQEL